MSLKISQLIQRTPNGEEYFEVIIPPFSPGTNRKVLLSDLANYTRDTVLHVANVDTTGALSFDLGGALMAILSLPVSFATPKTVSLVGDTNAHKFDFSFQITDVAAILTFPGNFLMSDTRWDESTQEWEALEIGKYIGAALFDGSNWFLTISPVPFV